MLKNSQLLLRNAIIESKGEAVNALLREIPHLVETPIESAVKVSLFVYTSRHHLFSYNTNFLAFFVSRCLNPSLNSIFNHTTQGQLSHTLECCGNQWLFRGARSRSPGPTHSRASLGNQC